MLRIFRIDNSISNVAFSNDAEKVEMNDRSKANDGQHQPSSHCSIYLEEDNLSGCYSQAFKYFKY